MGIRIHKILGYGLTDVKHGEYEITDSRFSKEYLEAKAYGLPDLTLKKYRSWIEKTWKGMKVSEHKYDLDNFDLPMEIGQLALLKFQSVSSCFTYCGEFGDPSIFVVTPLASLEEWRRYDDVIDYYEEQQNPIAGQPHAEILKYGIFPFNCSTKKEREIPGCIRRICEFCGVFVDKETVDSFKPLLYTYWS